VRVTRQSREWPEKQEREVKWFSAAKAAKTVEEPILSELIRELARKHN
jgi:hypothetical protein